MHLATEIMVAIKDPLAQKAVTGGSRTTGEFIAAMTPVSAAGLVVTLRHGGQA